MPKRTTPADATPLRVVVVTMDSHLSGAAARARALLRREFPGLELSVHAADEWGTDDAALHKDLKLPTAQLIIRKGFHADVDSYSAFEEADRKTSTGLAGYLKARGIKTVFVTGLATDFCVAWTALDARKAGFDAYVIEDATRAIDLNGSLAAAWKQMSAKGVKRIQSADIQGA